jgi:hypothetical protein
MGEEKVLGGDKEKNENKNSSIDRISILYNAANVSSACQ